MYAKRMTPILFVLVSLSGTLFGYGSYETIRALQGLNQPNAESQIQIQYHKHLNKSGRLIQA